MNVSTHTLSNNLRTIFIDTKAFPSATFLLLVNAGSRFENTKNNGIAHFFEHMAFKGSKKYPNALLLSSIIEGLGGEFNAFTSKDYTGYYVKAPVQYADTVLDVLSDMILTPMLLPKEIEKEKGVIVQEISMYEDTPRRMVYSLFDELMYKGEPLGMEIIGSKETVNSFKRSTFTQYMDSLYFANNAVLIVAGGLGSLDSNLTDKTYLKLVDGKFHTWKQGNPIGFTPVIERQTKGAVAVRYKKSEQAHLIFGYRAFKEEDNDKYALTVLSAILGAGMSSRLFTEVREKRGLCYSIYTDTDHYADVGSMFTYAGVSTDEAKVTEAIKVIRDQHELLVAKPVKDAELTRAKELLKGRLILSLEDTFNIALLHGKDLLHYNKYNSVQEILQKIDAVTAQEVQTVAKRVICAERSNLAIIGPFKSPKPFSPK